MKRGKGGEANSLPLFSTETSEGVVAKHKEHNDPTNVIISGLEPQKYWDIVVDKCEMQTVLMSYQYLKKSPKVLARRLEKHPNVKVFIDSGAHTFIANEAQYRDKPLEFWEEYLEGYTKFLRENKEHIFACADLDIDALVGEEQVNEWRAKYFEPLEIQVCYIWHENRGMEGWEEMCRKYSYIGMPNHGYSVQVLSKMFRIARKYNTRVHGMALTVTNILQKIPFYSADSTTWLVGQQFGECCYFDGRDMKRLERNQWTRNYKTKLMKPPLNADWDKLANDDTYELLRVNVLAFKLMQENVRKRLGAKMYWLPKKNNEVAVDKLDYPSYEWFQGGTYEGLDKYLAEFRMSATDFSQEEAVNVLYYFYLFLSDDEEHIAEIETDYAIQYAKQLGGNPESREEAIAILRQYFLDNATGARHDFESENSSLQPKERENYITDDAFETIELSEQQVAEISGKALPKPREGDMPEVDAYDKELKDVGVTVVRDSKGRFVKGQQRVRKPKNIYSSKYPKLACDTCYKSGECPQYKEGYVCAFDKMFKKFDTRNLEDIYDAMHGMVNMNMERLQKAMLFETLDGGLPTGEVTSLIDQQMKYMEKMKDLITHAPRTVVQQHRVIKEDGTESTVTSIDMNTNNTGLLSKIFGSGNDSEEESHEAKRSKVVEAEVIDE